jgi:serine phosphatase RsbU (regulator of sigma subunit)
MTTAALTSLIRPGALPSEILVQVDRVIRRGGSPRNFASLTLLRLDPETGEVLISNAGHPFPLLLQDGDATEIVLPGLPLGKGPRRSYQDVTLHLPPGAALVFCSDGLCETRDYQESPYGFDRPQEILRRTPDAPADSILEILLADWRSHLGSEEPPDDTTVVVVRRS